jgi:hypothetical protein
MRTHSILGPGLSVALLVFGCSTSSEPSGPAGPATGGTSGAGGGGGSGGVATGGTGGGVAGEGGTGGAIVSALCFSPTSGPSSLTGLAEVAATAQAVFVAHRNVLFQSADGKTGWTAKYDLPFGGHPISALVSHAGDIFVGLSRDFYKPEQPNVVYRAKADGSDWQPASTGLPPLGGQTGFGFANVDYLSDSGGKLIAVVGNFAHVFDDATGEWKSLEPDPVGLGAVDFAEWDGTGVVGNAVQLIGGVRYDGSSWQQIAGLPNSNYRAFAFSGGAGFTVHQGLLDRNGGNGWFQAHDFGGEVSDLFLDGTTLYALGESGVHASSDLGTTWKAGTIVNPPPTRSMGLAKLGATVVALGGETLHTTDDAGQSWQRSELVVSQVVELHELDGVVIAVVDPGELNTPRRTYRSTDDGATWTEISVDGVSPWEAAVDGERSYFVASGQPYVSENGGETLTVLNRPLNVSYGPLHIMAADGVVFASSSPWEGESPCGSGSQAPTHLENIGVARSTTGGLTWEPVQGLPVVETSCHGKKGYPTFLAVEQVGETTFAITSHGTFTSKDAGKSWTALGKDFQHVSGDAAHWVGVTETGIVLSADGGTTWTPSSALFGLTIDDLKYVDGIVYAAVSDGVYASGDWGTTFVRVDSTLTVPAHAVAVSEGQLFAAVGGQGVWRGAVCGGSPP